MLEIHVRSFDETPKAEAYGVSALSPDRKFLAVVRRRDESATLTMHTLEGPEGAGRAIARFEVPVDGGGRVDRRVAVAWPYTQAMCTVAAVSCSGIAVARFRHARSSRKATDPPVSAAFVTTCATAASDACEIRWDAAAEQRPETFAQLSDTALAAFAYPAASLEGIAVPRGVRVADVLGAWPWRSSPGAVTVAFQTEECAVGVSVLEFGKESVRLARFFVVQPSAAAVAASSRLCCDGNDWALFALSGGRAAHAVDCRNGSVVGSIRVAREGEPEFAQVAVSPDMRFLAAAGPSAVRVVDLERHFRSPAGRSPAPTTAAVSRRVELVPSREAVPEFARAARARETEVGPSEEGLRWFELGPAGAESLEPSASRGISAHTHAGLLLSVDTIPSVPNGFSGKRPAVSSSAAAGAFRDLQPPAGASEGAAVCAGTFFSSNTLVAIRTGQGGLASEAWVYPLQGSPGAWAPLLHKFEGTPLILRDGTSWLAITSGKRSGLCALVHGQAEQSVINNLIMFDLAEKADELCEVNAWDRRARRLNALELGLRYKQLDVVEHALGSLEHDQQIQGLKLLLERASATIDIPTEEDFNFQLLRIGTHFAISEALRPKVAAAAESPAEEATFNKAFAEPWRAEGPRQAHEMLELTALLESLRSMCTEIVGKKASIQPALPPPLALSGQAPSQLPLSASEGRAALPAREILRQLRAEDLFDRADVDRWSRLSDTFILREALLSGRVPTAVGFLHCCRTSQAAGGVSRFGSDWVRLVSAQLAYQSSCDGNYPDAATLLSNAGILPSPALSELLWHTSRRQLRRGLLSFLQGDSAALPPEDAVRFATLLEALHSSPSAAAEYERLSEIHRRRYVMQISTRRRPRQQGPGRAALIDAPQDLDDLTPSVLAKYGFEVVRPSLTAPFVPFSDRAISVTAEDSGEWGGVVPSASTGGSAPAGGFARFSLRWMNAWNEDTRERILIEREHELGARSASAVLAYALAHNDLTAISDWAKARLDPAIAAAAAAADGVPLFEAGKCRLLGAAQEAGFSEQLLDLATPFARQHAIGELAARGIFLESSLSVGREHFSLALPLIRRVAQGGLLFSATSKLPLEFHRAVVLHLADVGCLSAMRTYVEHHGLLPRDLQKGDPPSTWADFVAMLCSAWTGEESVLYDAGIVNARLLVRGVASLSATQLLSYYSRETADHPLLAIAMARYSTVPDQPVSVPAGYPTLARAMPSALQRPGSSSGVPTAEPAQDDISTSSGDTSLAALLGVPELSRRGRLVFSPDRAPGASFVDAELAAAAFKYRVGLPYFLSKGHPFRARLWAPAETPTAVLSAAFELCLRRPADQLLIASAACLLELHGVDSLALRVDCAALAALETNPSDQVRDPRALVRAARSSPDSARAVVEALQSLALGHSASDFDELTAAFCRIHGLPLSRVALERQAAAGDWAGFLVTADRQEYDPVEVLEVVRKSWSVPAMRDHLLHALAHLAPDQQQAAAPADALPEGSAGAIRNFIRAVEAVVRFSADPERVGTDGDAFHAFPFPLLLLQSHDPQPQELALQWIRHATGKPVPPDLRSALSQLLYDESLPLLRTTLALFLPEHPLAHAVSFFRCSLQKRFGEAARHAKILLAGPTAKEDRGEWKWARGVTIEASKRTISKLAAGREIHRLDHFLRTLRDSGLTTASPELAEIHATFENLRGTDVPLDLFLHAETNKLISELVSRSLYAEAVAVATRRKADVVSIHMAKAEEMVAQNRKQQCLWTDARERLELWARVHRHFLSSGVPQAAAGDFFYSRAHSNAGGLDPEKPDARMEQLMLLSLALSWFEGRQRSHAFEEPGEEEAAEDGEETEEAELEGEEEAPKEAPTPCKPAEFLRELETRVVLLRISLKAKLPLPRLGEGGFEGGSGAVIGAIVDHLVDRGQLPRARALCKRFGHSSKSLAAAEQLTSVARSADRLEGVLQSMSPSPTSPAEAALAGRDIEGALGAIASAHPEIARFSSIVLADFRAARELSIAYESVCSSKPIEILSHLAATRKSQAAGSSQQPPASQSPEIQQVQGQGSQRRLHEICEGFIRAHSLNPADVAFALADLLCDWVAERGASAKRSGKPLRHDMCAEWPRETIIEYASLSRLPSEFASRVLDVLRASSAPPPASAAPSSRIPTSPMRGGKARQSLARQLTHDAEVELAIVAYILYELACNGEGSQAIVGFLLSRTGQYAAANEYDLLRRILTGTRAYRDLYQLFDVLADSNRFELLLSGEDKGIVDEDSFQAALVRYLKQRRPGDSEKLHLVCLRFGLFHDIGRRLEEQAMEKLREIAERLTPRNRKSGGSQSPSKLIPSPSPTLGSSTFSSSGVMRPEVFQQTLLTAIQDLLQAADHYSMGKAYQNSTRCFHLATLVSLQARMPDTKVLMLTREEAKQLMALQATPRDAITIANAYGLRDDWARAIHQQVIIAGNLMYLDELRISIKLPQSTWWDVAKIFESEASQQSGTFASAPGSDTVRVKNFKSFLSRIDDLFLQFDIASKLKFEDVTSRLKATVPGLKYFRK